MSKYRDDARFRGLSLKEAFEPFRALQETFKKTYGEAFIPLNGDVSLIALVSSVRKNSRKVARRNIVAEQEALWTQMREIREQQKELDILLAELEKNYPSEVPKVGDTTAWG